LDHDFETKKQPFLNLFGYDVVRKSVVTDLGYCPFMRKIHCNDAVEIEELYRQFVFPDLPARRGANVRSWCCRGLPQGARGI
jgi:hypothetical protein